MGNDLVLQVATGVFIGNLGVLCVVWAFNKFKNRQTASFVEVAAFCGPLLFVAATVYLG